VSRYHKEPLDFTALKTIPIRERGGKVRVEDFARAYEKGAGLTGWIETLPPHPGGRFVPGGGRGGGGARTKGKPILWGLGGHVIKCGLAPVLIDLMRRGYATAFRDERVHRHSRFRDRHIRRDQRGRRGRASRRPLWDRRGDRARDEPGDRRGRPRFAGHRRSAGRRLESIADPRFAALEPARRRLPRLGSCHRTRGLRHGYAAYSIRRPIRGPSAAPRIALPLFCRLVSELHEGGVYLNLGSAVVLPEVFPKPSRCAQPGLPARKLHHRESGFPPALPATAQRGRAPATRARARASRSPAITELLLPLLAASLIERES